MNIASRTLLLGLMTVAAISQSANAITISTMGSFNDQSASSPYFYNRIYNQDDAVNPTRQLPSNLHATTDSVAYFGWGIDVGDSLITRQIIQSHFWFNGAGSVGGAPASIAPLGTAFSLGSFTYTNEQTILSGGLVEVDFQMAINIDGLLLAPLEYRLEINNTPNYTTTSYDTARIISSPGDILFSMNGAQYMLTLNGFSRDGGLTFETVANLREGMQTSAQIYATITAIPVPAAIWLMGSGVLALFGFARLKNK